ncbi:MAG: chromate transporter [Acidobacteriota bacterium]|nr:chromate transporter [Acidobacteriota bacterium]
MTTNTAPPPKDLIGFLDYYLVQKAPFQIPDAGREWIVQWGPWIAVVLMILSLPPLLVVLGIGTALIPFGGIGYAAGFTYLTVVLIVQVLLMLAALPGLFARKMAGWRLLFYAQLVSFVFSLLSGSIVGAILGTLIGLYILFQIRPLYTA